jgi:anaerobic ribonucleoside-triphosphate reductase activating protein
MSVLQVAGIVPESSVDGPGFRYAVYTQGCPHACPGCHNPETWAFEGGTGREPAALVGEMRRDPLLKGLTLTGGEPFSQAGACAELARLARAYGYDVICYTGWTWEELLEIAASDPDAAALLEAVDVLVDGRFDQGLKSYELRFKGSSNQRTIDAPASLKTGNVVLKEL